VATGEVASSPPLGNWGGIFHARKDNPILDNARGIIRLEMDGLGRLLLTLNDDFERAVALLADARRIVGTGVGKSGLVARLFAATLASLGIPAIWLHPTEAAHGDIGALMTGDVLVAFSKSGATEELRSLWRHERDRYMRVAITADPDSWLARESDVAVVIPVHDEIDVAGLVPTTSVTLSLVLGHVLVMGVAQRHGLDASELKRTHPGGSLGAVMRVA